MKAMRAGYTIVELMVVLAITGIIFASSVTIFSNRRASTEFSQAVLDLQSELQSFSTQVSTSNVPSGSTTYYCGIHAVSGEEQAYLEADSTLASPGSCIYLGRVLQVVPGANSVIKIYPVLGLSTIYSGSTNTGAYPTSPSQANPEPAVAADGSDPLTLTYSTLNGSVINTSGTIKGAHLSTSPTVEGDYLAVYTNLQSQNTSGNNTTAYARTGTVAFTSATADVNHIRPCIEEASPCGTATVTLNPANSWNLCIQDSNAKKKATISIKASASGITTSVTMDQCI